MQMSHRTVAGATANERALDEIREVIAGGASSNMLVCGCTAPFVIECASETRIWDVPGNELIDMNMGYGPHIFGYPDPRFADDVAGSATVPSARAGQTLPWPDRFAIRSASSSALRWHRARRPADRPAPRLKLTE
jgi:4-aminobutyrate aminotransferase-like enzyme